MPRYLTDQVYRLFGEHTVATGYVRDHNGFIRYVEYGNWRDYRLVGREGQYSARVFAFVNTEHRIVQFCRIAHASDILGDTRFSMNMLLRDLDADGFSCPFYIDNLPSSNLFDLTYGMNGHSAHLRARTASTPPGIVANWRDLISRPALAWRIIYAETTTLTLHELCSELGISLVTAIKFKYVSGPKGKLP